mgnify:CR=1 FL=1
MPMTVETDTVVDTLASVEQLTGNAFSFLFIFLIIAILLSISGLDFITSISGAASSISNVGPGLGDMIGPNGNYKDIPDLSKWILSLSLIHI